MPIGRSQARGRKVWTIERTGGPSGRALHLIEVDGGLLLVAHSRASQMGSTNNSTYFIDALAVEPPRSQNRRRPTQSRNLAVYGQPRPGTAIGPAPCSPLRKH